MKRFLIMFIILYQKYISPIKTPKCRFYPTCSKYAIDSIEKYGAIKGTMLAMWRILRCNPFNKGGFDPVR